MGIVGYGSNSAFSQLSSFFGRKASHYGVPAVNEARKPAVVVVVNYSGGNTPKLKASGFDNLSGAELFDALHDYVNDGAKSLSYGEARYLMYSQLDNISRNGEKGVLTAYSQILMPGTSGDGSSYREQNDLNGDGVIDKQGINAEHSWPQSFFREALPMKSDLHHLQSTFVTPNGRRGAYPYGMVSRAIYSTNSGSRLGSDGVFEPCDANKGNSARAMLYFMLRYHDRSIRSGGYSQQFWTNKVNTLLLWNRQDPPDENEIRRNELVSRYQNNRNPFIDDYTLADKIGASVWKSF
ncbi:MAG: endonuclease [Elusimicrobiaceae bacterium]|nr:endonuclease [Elusimicrobiaceae bacterium]